MSVEATHPELSSASRGAETLRPRDEAAVGAQAQGRDVSLDIVRGWCIVMMVVAHISPFSITNHLTHIARFASGASGFVAISGMTLGLVHRRRVAKEGEVGALLKVLRRTGLIWAVHCAIVLVGFVLIDLFGDYFAHPWNAPTAWTERLWITATLQFQPSNVLPMYVALLLWAVCMLPLMVRGYTWACLLMASIFYVIPQIEPWHTGQPREYIAGFDASARFLLFTGMLAVGLHQERIRAFMTPELKTILWRAAIAVFAVGFVVAQIQRPWGVPIKIFSPDVEYAMFGRPHMGIGRLLYAVSIVALGLATARYLVARGLLRQPLEWLQILGRNALYCFTLQSVTLFLPPALFIFNWPLLAQDAITIVALAGLVLAAKHKVLRRIIPN